LPVEAAVLRFQLCSAAAGIISPFRPPWSESDRALAPLSSPRPPLLNPSRTPIDGAQSSEIGSPLPRLRFGTILSRRREIRRLQFRCFPLQIEMTPLTRSFLHRRRAVSHRHHPTGAPRLGVSL
ncbi:hypothetical protein E2562_011380, partial [Oryza meyeriana var. granulata]